MKWFNSDWLGPRPPQNSSPRPDPRPAAIHQKLTRVLLTLLLNFGPEFRIFIFSHQIKFVKI